MNEIENVVCAYCPHLKREENKKGWIVYSCPFCENKTWLGGMCRDPFIEGCNKHGNKASKKYFNYIKKRA